MIAAHWLGFREGARHQWSAGGEIAQKVGNAGGCAKVFCDLAWDDEKALSFLHHIEERRAKGDEYTHVLKSTANAIVRSVVSPEDAARFVIRDEDVVLPNSLTMPTFEDESPEPPPSPNSACDAR